MPYTMPCHVGNMLVLKYVSLYTFVTYIRFPRKPKGNVLIFFSASLHPFMTENNNNSVPTSAGMCRSAQ